MPTNQGPEYIAAEREYLKARTREEKIACLENMIRTSVKHKGTEHLLADLRKRLARLKKEAAIEKKKSKRSKFSIRKEGAAQVCIIGLTNSGKSTLLNSLTNANVEVANHPYTTKEPEVGMMFYNDLQFQLIEIPSTFDPEFMGLLHSCDLIMIIIDVTQPFDKQKEGFMEMLKENNLASKKAILIKNKGKVEVRNPDIISIDAQKKEGTEELKQRIWKTLDMIKVYTKSPRKPRAIPAIAMKKNSTVEDFTGEVHKDFTKAFKFAKIFNSTKFSGKKVGLDYKLQDGDTVEVHTE